MFYLNTSPKNPPGEEEAYPFNKWAPFKQATHGITKNDFRGKGHPLDVRIIQNLINGALKLRDGYIYLAIDDEELENLAQNIAEERGQTRLDITGDILIEYLQQVIAMVNKKAKEHSMLRLQIPIFLARVSKLDPDYSVEAHHSFWFVIVRPPQPGITLSVVTP